MWHNSIWIGCFKLPLLRREYLSSAVNVLTKSLQILHITETDYFHLNCLHSDHWIWKRVCRSDLKRSSVSLPCCPTKGPLKRHFLDIYLTTFFGVRLFANTSAMRIIIFFCVVLKFSLDFKIKKKIRKNSLFFRY